MAAAPAPAATDQLEIRYIPLSQCAKWLWSDNPKRNDLGTIAASFALHGFKSAPRFEPHLNNGKGGINAGNGRVRTLISLKKQGAAPPRGIPVREDDGEWLVPIQFGVDAASQEAAESYGLDDNNSVLSGGDFTAIDMSRMWTDRYADMLSRLAEGGQLPATVDGDDLDTLLRAVRRDLDLTGLEGTNGAAPDPLAMAGGFTAGAGAGVGVGPAGLDAGLPPSYIRMVQLFLNIETQPEFIKMVQALMPQFGKDNLTDTVMEAVRYAYRELDLAAAR